MKNDLEVTFYHCTTVPLLKAIPSLLAKVYESKKRALVLCRDQESLDELDKYLWSFSTKIFLPHGTDKDLYPEKQPIFLSTDIKSINNPSVLLSLVNISDQDLSSFKSVIFMFFGNKKDQNVIDMYKKYSDIKSRKNTTVKFWEQDLSTGKWQQAQQ